jgi:hypothetical protein
MGEEVFNFLILETVDILADIMGIHIKDKI